MATKRQRGKGSWEFVVRRKGLLPKPISLTFYSEAEGDTYIAHLEKLLDKGIVPDEFKKKSNPITTLGMAIFAYIDEVHITDDDIVILNSIHRSIKDRDLSNVKYAWAEAWVKELRSDNLSPSTIRKKVGALARCLDWVLRRENTMLASNPLRVLPKRYATSQTGRKDIVRDRRLDPGEDEKIFAILNREKPKDRERPLSLPHSDALKLMYAMALGTMMRMREIYTLTKDQLSFEKKTIFLDRTKNGSKRQVPTPPAVYYALESYIKVNAQQIESNGGRLFPFWDGSLNPGDLRATTSRLSQQWQRIFGAAKCQDLRFHDLRHEATSCMFENTDYSDVEIAKIGGWSSTTMLMRYANLRGSKLADRMW